MSAAAQRGTSDRTNDGRDGLDRPTHCVLCGGSLPAKTPIRQLAWVSTEFRPGGKGWAHGKPSCKELEAGGFVTAETPPLFGHDDWSCNRGSSAGSQEVGRPVSSEIPMAAGPAVEGLHADRVADESHSTPSRPGDRVAFVLTIPGSEPYTSVRLSVERMAEPGSTLEAEFALLAEKVGAQAAACVERAMRAARGETP